MYSRLISILLVVLSVPAVASAAPLSKQFSSRIDVLAAEALQRSHTPGLSIAVLRDGHLVFTKGYGLRNLKLRALADASTRYAVGSLTKEFTAAIILQLIAEKRLSEQTAAGAILPEFRSSDIRIHNLLEQTSGLPDYNTAAFVGESFPAELPGRARPHAVLEKLATLPLHFTPGTTFEYSNANYFVLGFIAEKITGKPFATLLRERILVPLRMHSTGMDTGTGADEAQGYTLTDLGRLPMPQFDPKLSYAAGAVRASALDLARWNQALLRDPEFKDIFAQMAAPVRLTNGTLSPYGRGVFAYDYGSQRIAWHDGTVAGFKAMDVMVSPNGTAVIVLANADTAPAPALASQIRALFMTTDGSPPAEMLDAKASWWSRLLVALAALVVATLIAWAAVRMRRMRVRVP